MTKLYRVSSSTKPSGKDRNMRESNERFVNTGIYARIRELPITAADREQAIQALRQAELVADVFMAIKEKLASLGAVFLKPSLKH